MTCTEFLLDLARVGPVVFAAGVATGWQLRIRLHDRLTPWGTDDHQR